MLNSRKRTGFTLIELLVVIAIIAVLAAVLFPIFSSARRNAVGTRCLTNLKQLGAAFTRYIDDNGGRYPLTYWAAGISGYNNGFGYDWYSWKRCLDPYVRARRIMFCPFDLRSRDWFTSMDSNTAADLGNFELLQGYCGNGHILGPGNSVSESAIRKPTKCLLVGELPPGKIYDTNAYWRYAIKTQQAEQVIASYHNNGQNHLYCDMHAKWIPFNDIVARYPVDDDYNGHYLGWKTPQVYW